MKNENCHILLYYQYVPIENPEQFVQEHTALCKALKLKGRIIVASEGLNGTVAGGAEQIAAYKERLWADLRFADMPFKESVAAENPFPRLSVRVRDEIVTLGLGESIALEKERGAHLSPQEWHAAAQEDDVVILDGRNYYEAVIGKFKNAITPQINNFREFPDWVRENMDKLRGRKVLMYCTGGVRCEPASAFLKTQGIDDVYQLDGGIVNYGKEIPDGLWEGSCFVFDRRMRVQVNDDEHHGVISTCRFCDTKTDAYENCCNAECNKLILLCDECKERSNNACSEECSQKHRAGIVKHWDVRTRAAS